MSKKLTAKSLLREVQSIKKQALTPMPSGSRKVQWISDLWEYAGWGSGVSAEGKEIADYISDQSKYVAKYFKQVLKQNGLDIKLYNDPLDDGNTSDRSKVWGGQSEEGGMIAWGFFSNDLRPYVMFEEYIDGEYFEFFEHGPAYKSEDPIKQIRQAKAWLLGAIAELDEELSKL